MVSEGDSFIGHLTTVGRVTGRPHRVLLRLVYHAGRVYASRSDSSSDWCRNLIANPDVTVLVEGEELPASARFLCDEALTREVSRLKYPDPRADRRRILVEISPAVKGSVDRQ